MNVNAMLIKNLGDATHLPVVPDEYDGTKTEYITFTYTDEQPVFFGDNKVLADTAYLQIQLVTPKTYNYLSMKHIIRDTLEEMGFSVTSIRSFLGDIIQGTEKIRQTIFECSYTEQRGE